MAAGEGASQTFNSIAHQDHPSPQEVMAGPGLALLRTRGHNTSLSMNHVSRSSDKEGSACISFQKSDHRGPSVQMLRVT